jgi:hypothetical protein
MANELYLWQMQAPGVDGHVIGRSSSDKIAFFGGTPASRPSAPTAVATTVAISTTTTKWGYSTSTQANAIVTAVNTLIGIVTSLGMAA